MEEADYEKHFLLRCEGWRQGREMLAGFMDDLVGEFCMATDDMKVTPILYQACSNGRVRKAVEKICRVPNLYAWSCLCSIMFVPDPHN